MIRPQIEAPSTEALRRGLVTVTDLPCCCGVLGPCTFEEIPEDHRADRQSRQAGGETEALGVLNSFLGHRGEFYSSGISSPSSAWTSCSRLSPYLAAGHLSLRRLWQDISSKQADARQLPKGMAGDWPRSLAAMKSRLKWRSHFMQK